MPFAQIYMIEGRTAEQKQAVIEKVTQALVDAVEAPKENVRVYLVSEHAPGYLGFAASGTGEMFAVAPQGEVVCLPFIEMEPAAATVLAPNWTSFEGLLQAPAEDRSVPFESLGQYHDSWAVIVLCAPDQFGFDDELVDQAAELEKRFRWLRDGFFLSNARLRTSSYAEFFAS